MRSLFTILFVSLSLFTFAQRPQAKMMQHQTFTPEQQAVLQTKKMVLALDLNAKQEEKVLNLQRKWAADRQQFRNEMKSNPGKMKNLTSDQRYELMVQRLDRQIAHREALKKILTKNQFEKWLEMRDDRMARMQSKTKGRKMKRHCMRKAPVQS